MEDPNLFMFAMFVMITGKIVFAKVRVRVTALDYKLLPIRD